MFPAKKVKVVECPRDAMQGWPVFIPTQRKIAYLDALLQCGFDTVDFGSFVSPKAIPQLADTKEVVRGLDLTGTSSKLLAIVANKRGGEEAMVFDEINCIGFPFSVSPTFQQRNTNSTLNDSFELVEELQNLCTKNQKELVVYISMGFGNPYGDAYSPDLVSEWVERIVGIQVTTISIADTVGLATPAEVGAVMNTLIPAYPNVEIGVHLHSSPVNWQAKVDAALQAGCTRFDGALKGIGGCPMAGDDLVGNMDSELMVSYFDQLKLVDGIRLNEVRIAAAMASQIFVPAGKNY